MNIRFVIDKDSAIIAVKLKVVAGEATSLNDNATADDVYIATLVANAGVALFTAGATKPSALSEPDLINIPATGIPSANYAIYTTEDDITGSHSWDTVDLDFTITNADVYGIIDDRANKISGGTENAIIIQDSDGDLVDSEKTIEDSTDDEPSDSDVKIPTSKLIRDWLASLDAGYGSSVVGVRDSAGYFTGTNVEAVLAEIGAGISRSIFSLAGKTCTPLATYYSNLEKVRATTPPIQDSSDNAGIGIYRFQYVYKNATVATPSSGITWATEATEISSPENYMEAPVPENGDVLYSGGTAGNAYFYCRIRFENQSSVDGVTDWAYLDPGVTIAEPDLLSEKFLDLVVGSTASAQQFITKMQAGFNSSPIATELVANAQDFLSSGSGAPTTTPTDARQEYRDTSAGDLYKVLITGTTYSWGKVN